MQINRSEITDDLILGEIFYKARDHYYELLSELLPTDGFTRTNLWYEADKTLRQVMPEDRFEGNELNSILYYLRSNSTFVYTQSDIDEFRTIVLVYLKKQEEDIFNSALNEYVEDSEVPDENDEDEEEEVTEAKGEWIA
ncbi:hypothetical protein [Variovorax sp. RA8]|uniref:hypothetical protein n=1 Tax=Variovorax sp. (strain JCM 16519 / RA8) TaxID=662548 RepID=UPI000AF9FE8A|nr:hypothetical protein [Variovorax sp. RA8]